MNGHRPFSLGSGNGSKCPIADLQGGRGIGSARWRANFSMPVDLGHRESCGSAEPSRYPRDQLVFLERKSLRRGDVLALPRGCCGFFTTASGPVQI
jgi:hypothetical protein